MRLQKLDLTSNMEVDVIRIAHNFEPKYRITMLTTQKWAKGPGTPPAVKGLVWYTDRSSAQRGIGDRIYGQSAGRRVSISYKKNVTVFQARIYAILACA
jgi:hypothetical protein